MADRAHLIEDQWYTPKWFAAQQDKYVTVQYLNHLGTIDPGKLPMRSWANPVLRHSRHPQSMRRLNEYKSRYHHPGGLTYYRVDREGLLNSSAKLTESDNYVNTEIRANPGIWGHGY